MVAVHRDLAQPADHRSAVVVEYRHHGARERAAQRARLGREHRLAVAEGCVQLGLAVALVHPAAEEVRAPSQQIGADGFAAGGHHPQGEATARESGGADHPQRGGVQHGQGDPERPHQPDGAFGGELRVEVDHDREAVVPGRHENVHDPGQPCPIRRRGKDVLGLRVELVDHLEGRDVAEQHPMRVQCALRVAGGPGRVDEDRRVIGACPDRLELR